MPPELSTDELLAELERFRAELGRIPTSTDMNEHGAYTYPTYRKYFGGWEETLRAAGFDLADYPHESGRRYTRAELLTELERVAEKVGRTPRRSDIEAHARCSFRPFRREFDSWTDALEAVGFDPGPRQRQHQDIPREELLAEIRQIAEQAGHTPSARKFEAHGKYSLTAYEHNFQRWNEALRAAGFEPRELPPSERTCDRTPANHYNGLWKEIRKRALERDDHECQSCGMAMAEHEERFGVELNVHHVTPVREFETSDEADQLDNLETLCAVCHGLAEQRTG